MDPTLYVGSIFVYEGYFYLLIFRGDYCIIITDSQRAAEANSLDNLNEFFSFAAR